MSLNTSDINSYMVSCIENGIRPKNYYAFGEKQYKVLESEFSNGVADNLASRGMNVFESVKVNLVDSSTLQYGKIMDNLTISYGTGWGSEVSYFIEVVEGESYTLNSQGKILACDKNKTIVKAYDSNSDIYSTTTIAIDDGIKYIRACGSINKLMICKGTKADYPKQYINGETYNNKFKNEYTRSSVLQDLMLSDRAKNELAKALHPDLYGKKWACLGDSLTTMHWTANMYSIVSGEFGITPIDYGIVSSTIATYYEEWGNPMCNRYVEMVDDADIITVMGGTNDSGAEEQIGLPSDRADNPVTLYGGCHKLFSGLIAKYPDKKIGVILPPQHGRCYKEWVEAQGGDLDLVAHKRKCEAIREVARFYSLPVLDLCNEGGLTGLVAEHRDKYIQGDKLHLTPDGYKVLARRLSAWIKTL